jgi:hypothetical protein
VARATPKGTRKRAAKKPKFSGKLAKPLKHSDPPLLLTDEQLKRWGDNEYQRLLAAQLAKLPLLMEHYDVAAALDGRPLGNETRYLMLALRLARDFVPGFMTEREHPRKGRRSRQVDRNLLLMKVETEKLLASRKLSDSEACELILRDENFDRVPNLAKQAENLATEVSRARNPEINPAAPAIKKLFANLHRRRTGH